MGYMGKWKNGFCERVCDVNFDLSVLEDRFKKIVEKRCKPATSGFQQGKLGRRSLHGR